MRRLFLLFAYESAYADSDKDYSKAVIPSPTNWQVAEAENIL